LDIYGHLQVAEEILKSNDLNPELKEILNEYNTYFNLGNFVPDLEYAIVKLMFLMVLKNTLFGYQDYRRTTKRTNLVHIKSCDLIINAFKSVDDEIRYYDRNTVIAENHNTRKHIALLCGIIGHIFADRFIHYIIEQIENELVYTHGNKADHIMHQRVEISFSYYWLKSKDMDWYNFSDRIRVPYSKKCFRRLMFVRDETITSMLQHMEFLTFGDSMSGNKIKTAINNLISVGKYMRFFSIYRKIKKGEYIFNFDELKDERFTTANLLKQADEKVVLKIVIVLNKIFELLTGDTTYFDKTKKAREIIRDIDAIKPEVYDF
jgi:uncharacterized protein (UPF0297 family)